MNKEDYEKRGRINIKNIIFVQPYDEYNFKANNFKDNVDTDNSITHLYLSTGDELFIKTLKLRIMVV